MIRTVVGVWVAVGVGLVSARASASEWWVDEAAAPGGDGSQAAPFERLNDVIEVLETGDTVWVADGTYQETVNFWQVPDGTGGRTTVRAAPGAHPVIDGGGTEEAVLQAGETPEMTFEGLTVKNSNVGIAFYQADGGQVLGCTTESTEIAVEFYFAGDGYVQGSTLNGSVSGKGTDGTVVEDNEIYGSPFEGIGLHADSKNCRYSRNVVHDHAAVNIYLDSISSTVVDSNLVYMTLPAATQTSGIMLADESYDNVTAPVMRDIVISNNVLIGNAAGIRFWEGEFPGQSGLKGVTIVNNTVLDTQGTSLKWDAGPHEDTVIENNIFAANNATAQLLLQANSTSGVSLDHNLWYLPGATAPFLWGESGYDHAEFAAASGQGQGDVVEEPKLVGEWSLPVDNVAPTADSPVIDRGTSVSVDHDYRGAARPAGEGYDLGAFEYGATTSAGGGGGAGGDAGATTTGGTHASSDGGSPTTPATAGSSAAGDGGSPTTPATAGSSAAGDGGSPTTPATAGSSAAGDGGSPTTPATAGNSAAGDGGGANAAGSGAETKGDETSDNSGCGCRVGVPNGAGGGSSGAFLVAVLLSAGLRRRRGARSSPEPEAE
jgi:hypothetical protein